MEERNWSPWVCYVLLVVCLTVVFTLTSCYASPSYPKYHLVQQVKVDGCIGVVVEARATRGGGWKYRVGFELTCPTCKSMPQWLPKDNTVWFNEGKLSPVAIDGKTEAAPDTEKPAEDEPFTP